MVQRFKDKTEEYGIEVVEVSEYKTSTLFYSAVQEV